MVELLRSLPWNSEIVRFLSLLYLYPLSFPLPTHTTHPLTHTQPHSLTTLILTHRSGRARRLGAGSLLILLQSHSTLSGLLSPHKKPNCFSSEFETIVLGLKSAQLPLLRVINGALLGGLRQNLGAWNGWGCHTREKSYGLFFSSPPPHFFFFFSLSAQFHEPFPDFRCLFSRPLSFPSPLFCL